MKCLRIPTQLALPVEPLGNFWAAVFLPSTLSDGLSNTSKHKKGSRVLPADAII